MLGVQRGAQLCSAESTVRSSMEWGTLDAGAGVGRQCSSSWGTHARDSTESKRDSRDGVEGSVSRSLVHLFSFIKLMGKRAQRTQAPEMLVLSRTPHYPQRKNRHLPPVPTLLWSI